jgi:MYXO-CTERM domain-containing protein
MAEGTPWRTAVKACPVVLVVLLAGWSQQQELLASDGVSVDAFGGSVSVSEDTALVGAAGKGTDSTGAAYVFVRNGTTWAQQQELLASDGALYDAFGVKVSVSGDTALLGALGKNSGKGAAYVVVRTGATWTQQQELLASDGAAWDRFGASLSLAGDTALVGAHAKDNGKGVAYVFVRTGAAWSQQQKLLASDGASGDQFGYSVSLSGDTAVVGAYGKDNWKGAAYVFVRSGATWTEQQQLLASDGEANDDFGTDVSVSENTVLVGASTKDTVQGAAYVFVRDGTTWIEQQKLVAGDGASYDAFGGSVSVSGNTALVAAQGKGGRGAVYVFLRSATVWTEAQKFLADDGAPLDTFGCSVSLSGETALVGAFDKANARGAAYVFVSGVADGGVEDSAAANGGTPDGGRRDSLVADAVVLDGSDAQTVSRGCSCEAVGPGGPSWGLAFAVLQLLQGRRRRRGR